MSGGMSYSRLSNASFEKTTALCRKPHLGAILLCCILFGVHKQVLRKYSHQALFNMQNPAAMHDYKRVRGECAWRDTSIDTLGGDAEMHELESATFWEGIQGGVAGWYNRNGVLPPRQSGIIRECEVGDWVVTRVGPFTGYGAYPHFDWHHFIVNDVGHFSSKTKHQSVWLTAVLLAPVTPDGDMLGFPPIHNHHVHLNPVEQVEDVRVRITKSLMLEKLVTMSNGNEGECSRSAGGTDCYLEMLAPGYGFEVCDRLYTNGIFQDARIAGAPPLTFWAEIATRWTRTIPKASLSTLYGMSPMVADGFHTGYFFIPARETSLFWYGFRWPASGTLYNLEIHSHERNMLSTHVLPGLPRDIGIDGPNFERNVSWEALPVDPRLWQNTRDYLLQNAARHGVYPKCWQDKPGLDDVGSTSPYVLSDVYDRRPIFECESWMWRAGDPVTVFSFWHNEMNASAPGHNIITVKYIETAPGSRYRTLLGSSSGEHSLMSRDDFSKMGTAMTSGRIRGVDADAIA